MMAEELVATRQKKRRRKKHREHAEVAAAPSASPRRPATPDPKAESLLPLAPETLSSTAAAIMRGKERKRQKQEDAAAASPLVEEAVQKSEEKHKRKRRKHEEAAATPSPSAAAQILEVEGKVVAVARKKRRRGKVEQEQSGQGPLPVDGHPQRGEEAADGGTEGSQSVKRSSSNKPRVLTTREIIRIRMELKKQQPLPEGFVTAMANPNSIDQDPNHSSPFGAFFDQFCYKPDRQQNYNALLLPETPDRPARPPSRGRPSSGSSWLTANDKAAKTTTSNTKQPCLSSASGSQEEVMVKEKEKPEKMMIREKKPRKPPPLLSAAEKRSDKYRRLPLDQLVPPPRSPHKLLQEKYASDPWKVIVICMLLNLTHGRQVRKKVKGFFKRYPDPQTAYHADPEKMAEYLAPLGLQRVKANRIQRFSKAYVEKEWTYITELCGVGKYAADAYAIFCAGRATEVVPEDHKLVDYWKYVCFVLPLIQASQNGQERGMTEVVNVVPKVQELAMCC